MMYVVLKRWCKGSGLSDKSPCCSGSAYDWDGMVADGGDGGRSGDSTAVALRRGISFQEVNDYDQILSLERFNFETLDALGVLHRACAHLVGKSTEQKMNEDPQEIASANNCCFHVPDSDVALTMVWSATCERCRRVRYFDRKGES